MILTNKVSFSSWKSPLFNHVIICMNQIKFSVNHKISNSPWSTGQYLKTGCAEYIGVLQTPMKTIMIYSTAHLIQMANAWKNHENYLRMWIIRAYFTLCFYQWWRVVSRVSVRIKHGMWISEDQIIQAILYIGQPWWSWGTMGYYVGNV